jgi:hypothetical protein
MLSPSVKTGDIRPVTPSDLLGHRVIETQVDLIAGYLSSKRILETGAGGSIGSERCVASSTDRDESALHDVLLCIDGRAVLDDRAAALCHTRWGCRSPLVHSSAYLGRTSDLGEVTVIGAGATVTGRRPDRRFRDLHHAADKIPGHENGETAISPLWECIALVTHRGVAAPPESMSARWIYGSP